MVQLVVVRHGQASLLSDNYDQLSELGRGQASALGRFWVEQGARFDAVFAGPAQRQRDTARLVGEAMSEEGRAWPEVTVLPELDEHDAFALVRKAVPVLQAEDPDIARMASAAAAATTRAERSAAFQNLFEVVMHRWIDDALDLDEIEPWPAFEARVRAGLEQMLDTADRGHRIAAFTSVGPLAVLLQMALETSERRSFETAWRIRNASITTFVSGRGMFTLDSFNGLPHLSDPDTHTFR